MVCVCEYECVCSLVPQPTCCWKLLFQSQMGTLSSVCSVAFCTDQPSGWNEKKVWRGLTGCRQLWSHWLQLQIKTSCARLPDSLNWQGDTTLHGAALRIYKDFSLPWKQENIQSTRLNCLNGWVSSWGGRALMNWELANSTVRICSLSVLL